LPLLLVLLLLTPDTDASGKVRVWAWTHAEHLLKKETPALGGEVEDLAWDGESKRIVAVGGGASKAKVFGWDTGSNLGELIPHSKKIITCDLRPVLPHRLIMGGEDFPAGVSLYNGAPFKYSKGVKEHTNFINCTRFSPNGALFVSVSSDKSARVYSGDTGDAVARLSAAAMHAGSVFCAAWSPDGTRLATSGGDKCVKVWDMAPAAAAAAAGGGSGGGGGGSGGGSGGVVDLECLATFSLGTRPEDMQQSIVWLAGEGGAIVSTSLEGTLNFFNPADVAAGPTRRVWGHNAPLVALECSPSAGGGSDALVTACAGGRLCVWAPKDEAGTLYEATAVTGAHAPTKKCAGIALAGGLLAVASWDDKLRLGRVSPPELTASVALGAQPRGVAASPAAPEVRVVVTAGGVLSVAGGAVVGNVAVGWRPTCCDVSSGLSGGALLVVVGGEDKKVHFFTLDPASGALQEVGEAAKEASAAISCVAISPDGAHVAVGDAGREVRLFAAATRECLVSGRWMAHTTRVTGLKWSPNGACIASVASDRRLAVWTPGEDTPKLTMDLAHAQPFAGCSWASNTELWVLGTDGVAEKKKLAV
jgi:WD40 repeat protein